MENQDEGVERRQCFRKTYTLTESPRLKIGINEFEVIDISEKGIKFQKDKKINVEGWVQGTIMFRDNRYINFDGIVVRNRDGEIGLHLIDPIDVDL